MPILLAQRIGFGLDRVDMNKQSDNPHGRAMSPKLSLILAGLLFVAGFCFFLWLFTR